MTGKGIKSKAKSVEICVVAYDIHQGSFFIFESVNVSQTLATTHSSP